MNAPRIDQEQVAAEAAEEAFDRSANYQWCGHDITWAGQHNWLWLAIVRSANYTGEQVALAMMWVGTRDDIRATERQWRNDWEGVYDELSDFMAQFIEDDNPTNDALKVGGQIRDDISASSDDPASDGEEVTGSPKKSQVEPVTCST